jgi:ADP-ribose pyrophosphatase YjhB (NUDIX family)
VESPWLTWAKRLHALASTGLHFGGSEFDKERYQEVADIAKAMLADLSDLPIERLSQLMGELGAGYVTPQVDVRGAVFREGEILLVKEKSDGRWTLPGGYADVGLSAAENVRKEIFEEASIDVRVQRLIAVRHKAKHGYRPDIRDFYKFFFLCEATDQASAPAPGFETADARYFQPDLLPELSTGRVIEEDLHLAWSFARDATLPTQFD